MRLYTSSFQPLDEEEDSPSVATPSSHDSTLDRQTVKKLDLLLLPFLSLLFLVNSLDRSNLGNVETAHFTRDAGLQPEDLNTAVACFFAFFVLLQPFSAAAGRRFGMGRWVPSVMGLWGICTVLHIWVTRRWQLIVLRILIGSLEAGFYPTTVSYLSLFYTRFEFARRLSVFYGQYAVAGALGGLISYVVFSAFPDEESAPMQGGLKAWQVLFLVEGSLTVTIAVIGFVWLPRSAGTAWFLSPQEQEWAEERIRRDRDEEVVPRFSSKSSSSPELHAMDDNDVEPSQADHLLTNMPSYTEPVTKPLTSDAGLARSDILSTVLSLPLILPLLILNIFSSLPSTAFSIFLPLVLSSLSLASPIYSNLLAVPPFLLAACTLYLFTHYSDRTRQRFLPILAGLALILLGLLITVLLPESRDNTNIAILKYLTLCLLLSGSFIPSPLTVAWLAGNIPSPGKRAVVLGINGWGNLSGVLAAAIFHPRFRENGYKVPFWVTFVLVVVSWLGFALYRRSLRWINAERARVVMRWDRDAVRVERRFGKGPGWCCEGRRRLVDAVWVAWDRGVRRVVGGRLLGMERDESEVRRGDERLTFTYGL